MAISGPFEMAAAAPPKGITPDFNQNSDIWPSFVAVSAMSLAIIMSAMAARIYAKVVTSKERLGWEECKTFGNLS
jgi:hypothetical protein